TPFAPGVFGQEVFDRFGLAEAVLEDCPASSLQQVLQLRQEDPIGLQSVGTASERSARLPPGNLGLQFGDLLLRNIGRITDEQIKALSQSLAPVAQTDRKSTRLNSSHVKISYAVFCLK